MGIRGIQKGRHGQLFIQQIDNVLGLDALGYVDPLILFPCKNTAEKGVRSN